MSRKVVITHTRGRLVQCSECDRLNPDATRERCRQHADRNPGHMVRFVVEETTRYFRPTEENSHGQ